MPKFITNKNRQKLLDLEKWFESKKLKQDMSGCMTYCSFCPHECMNGCKVSHEERVANSLCAVAYNKMQISKRKKNI